MAQVSLDSSQGGSPGFGSLTTIPSVVGDETPLPSKEAGATEEEDEALLDKEAWVVPPFRADYGTNLRLGDNVFINFNCAIIDTCLVSIGARTLLAPNVSLYSGTHPLDPELRNGTKGPEFGKPITIEEDVWICGNVTICAGVTVGRGSTVGAGSVVTKVCPCPCHRKCSQTNTCMQSVAPYTVVAGNPAKFIKHAPRNTTTHDEREQLLKMAYADSSHSSS